MKVYCLLKDFIYLCKASRKSRQASLSWVITLKLVAFFVYISMVYFCYIDESGTPQVPGNTSHYVLCGVSIPVKFWKKCDRTINYIKRKYGLEDAEIHTGWIMRTYLEQSRIPDFENLSFDDRRREVIKMRMAEIFKVQKEKNTKGLKQLKKNYKHTDPYIHLTHEQRMNFLREIADLIGKSSFIRIFAECIDKVFFDPTKSKLSVDEQALEQLVSRFEHYMANVASKGEQVHGLLVHDNNETVCKKHTALMKQFHKEGTLWTSIKHIVETPFFVNSELTGMIQIADLCSIALRRFFENGDTDLFNRIYPRFDKHREKLVGVRHFTETTCTCEVCANR